MSIILLLVLIASCSGPKNERTVASDSEKEKLNENYYKHRGAEGVKFEYDRYRGQPDLFLKAFAKRKNRQYTSALSKRRQTLFEENLFDTGVNGSNGIDCSAMKKRVHRTAQGECYFMGFDENLSQRDRHLANQVMMGSKNQRFGRNIEKDRTNKASKQDIMTPSPLEISQKLLTRTDGKTKKAEVINVFAAAWLQAMNHDWFTHGKNSKTRTHRLKGHASHKHFKDGIDVPATQAESDKERSTLSYGYDKTFRNRVTHWWDASQIYGSDAETIRKVRGEYNSKGKPTGRILADGKIAVDMKKKRLYYDEDKLPITGFHDNWWVGLELFHSLFHMEHNRIVEKILKPVIGKEVCIGKVTKSDCGDELFEKARMINAALIAKIHTVEWTPALLDNAVLHIGMRGNWFGLREVAKGNSKKLRGMIPDSLKHLISGLVGAKTLDLYGTPFTLTEEFVAVYRMHPLVPEVVTMRNHRNDKVIKDISMKNMIYRKVPDLMEDFSSADWMHSFGTSHPGALTLHNYPTFMQNFVAEGNTAKGAAGSVRMDMGAIDVIRDRERGVPRYNEFRRGLHLPPMKSFEELTNNKEDVKILKEVYNNDIEKLDLIIGTLAENDRYPGYAFGNTPFFIFAAMASRRLMADPFFSDYYTPKYYTTKGIEHIETRTMMSVILNHYPELYKKFTKPIEGETNRVSTVVSNAFRPWLPVFKEVKEKINK